MLLHILNLGEIDDTSYPRELVVMTTRFSIANTVDLAPLGFEALYLLPPSPKAAEGILGTSTNDVLVGADPLRLRMLGMVSKIDGKDAAVGMSRRRLYDRILEVLLNRCTAGALQSDSLRFTVCELGVLLLGRGLERMAVAAHEALLVEMTASDVQRAFDDPRTAAAVWLLARAGQLPPLEPRGDSHIGFFHLTFQEHLAATGVGCGMFDEGHRLEDPWWQTVMLSGLSLLRGDDEYGMALDAAAKHHRPLEVGMLVDKLFDDGTEESNAVIYRIVPQEIRTMQDVTSEQVRGVELRRLAADMQEVVFRSETVTALFLDDEPGTRVKMQQVRRVQGGAAALLRSAAAAGDLDVILGLVSRGVDVLTSIEQGTKNSALHVAASAGQYKVVKALTDLRMRPEIENSQGLNAIVLARAISIPPMLRQQMSRLFEPDTLDEEVELDCVHDESSHAYLLCHHIHALQDPLQEIEKTLLSLKKKQQRAAINPGLGTTPLMFAAYHGRLDVVQFLLRVGAEVNRESRQRCAALHFSCYQGAHKSPNQTHTKSNK